MAHGGSAKGGQGEETRGMCPHVEVVGWWWPTASVDGADAYTAATRCGGGFVRGRKHGVAVVDASAAALG